MNKKSFAQLPLRTSYISEARPCSFLKAMSDKSERIGSICQGKSGVHLSPSRETEFSQYNRAKAYRVVTLMSYSSYQSEFQGNTGYILHGGM
jgi:hypothetical protein